MRGILVAGAAADAGEAAVARALAEEARRSGEGVALVTAGPADGAVPPAIAARHAGFALEPAQIVGEARAAADGAFLVVTTAGGLLAPVAERYANRDLALELRPPVVLAVPARPGLQNGALLALEAARGAGLTVPAVVLTGWPDPPSRALLDERVMLERHAGVPVDHLRDGADWPVVDWAAVAATTEAAPPARVALDPYEPWEGHPVGDPRQAPRAAIMETMLEIVAAEGPMRASRAYALYNRAAGGRKLTSVARARSPPRCTGWPRSAGSCSRARTTSRGRTTTSSAC